MEWISLEKERPTRENGYDWVLVIAEMIPEGNLGVPAVAELINNTWYFRDLEQPAENELSIKVTHWMALPNKPNK